MTSGYIEVADKVLDPGDRVQKTYEGRCDGQDGYLILSNRKLLFVNEKGFLRKTYSLVLDMAYEKVGQIVNKGRHELEINEVGGRKYDFTSPDTPISIIVKSLKDLIKSADIGKDD